MEGRVGGGGEGGGREERSKGEGKGGGGGGKGGEGGGGGRGEEAGKEEEGIKERRGKEEGKKEEEEEKVREESWRLLNRLETSEEVVGAVKVGGGWEEVGKRGGSYFLLYCLNIIESLLEEEEAGETFMTEFVSKGGFEWIIKILKEFNGKEKIMLTILDTNIISLALKIVKNYLLAAISSKNKTYFKIVNIAKLTYINLDNIAYILSEKVLYEVYYFSFITLQFPPPPLIIFLYKEICSVFNISSPSLLPPLPSPLLPFPISLLPSFLLCFNEFSIRIKSWT